MNVFYFSEYVRDICTSCTRNKLVFSENFKICWSRLLSQLTGVVFSPRRYLTDPKERNERFEHGSANSNWHQLQKKNKEATGVTSERQINLEKQPG